VGIACLPGVAAWHKLHPARGGVNANMLVVQQLARNGRDMPGTRRRPLDGPGRAATIFTEV